jgi:hypothetical protein
MQNSGAKWLTTPKEPTRYTMNDTCHTLQFAADVYLLELQCLKNKDLCKTGNFPRFTSTCKLYVVLEILYMYDLISK